MKKMLALALAVVMVVSFSGCSLFGVGGTSKAPKTIDVVSTTPEGDTSEVHVVFPSSGFNF